MVDLDSVNRCAMTRRIEEAYVTRVNMSHVIDTRCSVTTYRLINKLRTTSVVSSASASGSSRTGSTLGGCGSAGCGLGLVLNW